MGQDFRAVIGHTLQPGELAVLPTRLDEVSAGLRPKLEVLGIGAPVAWSWRHAFGSVADFSGWFDARVQADGVATLWATEALWIHATPYLLEIGSWVRWRQFATKPPVRDSMRKVCHAIAGAVDAEVVHYFPDSACAEVGPACDTLFDGGNLQAFEEALLRHGGPSRPTIQAAADGGYFTERLA